MVKVQEVEIPFSGKKDKAWITPFWYDVLEFYPTYVQEVKARGEQPWPVQPYMLAVAKELKKGGYRDEYTEDQLVQRCFEHFGLVWFSKYVEEYKGLCE